MISSFFSRIPRKASQMWGNTTPSLPLKSELVGRGERPQCISWQMFCLKSTRMSRVEKHFLKQSVSFSQSQMKISVGSARTLWPRRSGFHPCIYLPVLMILSEDRTATASISVRLESKWSMDSLQQRPVHDGSFTASEVRGRAGDRARGGNGQEGKLIHLWFCSWSNKTRN